MGRAQAFSFIIPWELVSLYLSCVEPYVICVLNLICFICYFYVKFGSWCHYYLRRHGVGYYLWLSYLWGEICIRIIFYPHAQGMIVNTNLNPFYVMSLCFANEVLIYISCHIPLWHPFPICGFPFICATCLICTHLGGGAIIFTWYDLSICKS